MRATRVNMTRMKKTIGRWRKVGQVLYTEINDDDDFDFALTSVISLLSFTLQLVVTIHIFRVLGK